MTLHLPFPFFQGVERSQEREKKKKGGGKEGKGPGEPAHISPSLHHFPLFLSFPLLKKKGKGGEKGGEGKGGIKGGGGDCRHRPGIGIRT